MTRESTKKIKIGNLYIGGGKHILIQSMSTILPSNTERCIAQIKELEKAGCEIVRVAVKTIEDAKAIKELKKAISIPIVADIHFDYRLGIESINSGCDKIRFNPGNIGSKENLYLLLDACKEKHIPIRIGVNAGSIDKQFSDDTKPVLYQALLSLRYYVSLCEEHNFHDIVLSIKMSNVNDTIKAYEEVSVLYDYPLHIGLTEAGIGEKAIIKSSIAMGVLLHEGIGDTIRVSLTGNPVNEVYVAKNILKSLNLLDGPNLISCPTCGRCMVDLEKYAKEINDYLSNINKQISVAVMGCIVNGPGEAREADIGVAFMEKKGVLFKKGVTVFTGTPDEAIEKMKDEIAKY